jgi:trigger factor
MKITTKEKGDHVVALTVSLGAEELAKQVERTKEQFTKEVSVDGFRKGKAPDEVASQHISDERLKETALQVSVEASFSDAVQEQGWDVAKTGDLKILKNTPEELTYSVLVSVWPTFVLGDLSRFGVARQPVNVTDEQVQEALDTLRNMKATFLDKEGSVADGDRVEIDFTAKVDGKQIPGGEGKNHPLVVGGKTFMPGFEEQLIGLRSGDSKEFDITAPEDYSHPNLAGKTMHFEATIRAVQIVMRPEVNDELAHTLKFESVEALKQAARESVAVQERAKERDRVRLAIMDKVLADVTIPTPDFLLQEEIEQMTKRFEQELQSKGLGLDLYLARLGKSRDELKTQWKNEAVRQVRMSLVVRQIIKEQKIDVGEQEVDAMLKDTVSRFTGQEGIPQDALDPDALRRNIVDRMLTEKALAHLERVCVGSES